MARLRRSRDRQRGNSLLLALIVMSALATLGSLTVVSMQSSLKASTSDRAGSIALYAAESGAAVAMDFLRQNFDASAPGWTSWSAYLVPNNANVPSVPQALIPSNLALPGTPNNLFSADQNAWFDIQLLNNRDDTGFGAGGGTNDTDGILTIRSTGHGPQGSLAIVEWQIQRVGYWWSVGPPPFPPPFPILEPRPSLAWAWMPPPPPAPPAPLVSNGLGMVLLGWRIVSL